METPESAAQSYATFVSGVWMGIVTNVVLELVLVCRVHLLKGVPGGPAPRTLKILRWAVGCQLVPLAVMTLVTSKPVRNQISRRLRAASSVVSLVDFHLGTGCSTT